jgi:hypothetical protein
MLSPANMCFPLSGCDMRAAPVLGSESSDHRKNLFQDFKTKGDQFGIDSTKFGAGAGS